MSGRARSIGIAVAAMLAVLAGIAVYYYFVPEENGHLPSGDNGTELVEEAEGETAAAEADAPGLSRAAGQEEELLPAVQEPQYRFVLVSENDYVVVYELPGREIYEYTDLILDVLPEDVRQEIRDEKYVKNEEELYNFLENYTS